MHLSVQGEDMLTRRKYLLGSISAGIGSVGSCASASPPDFVLDALRQTVGPRQNAGTAVVYVDDGAESYAAYGSTGASNLMLDARAIFEIGSITKVLTALLLAEMAARGEVSLEDILADHVPPSVMLPDHIRSITLRDLASYSSGLPNMPANLPARWYLNPNPFVDYTVEQLYEALSHAAPAAGGPFAYSSFAFGVLGVALARRAGKSYEDLLLDRVCNPLGLSHTRITLTRQMRRRLVQGHDVSLAPTARWDFAPALQAAGGVCASVRDASALLKACMGVTHTPLEAPLARLLDTRRPTSLAGTEAALGWFISSSGDGEIAWKSGLTAGCNTFVGFSTRRRRGVFVLSNFLWRPLDVGTTAMGMRMIVPGFDAGDLALLY